MQPSMPEAPAIAIEDLFAAWRSPVPPVVLCATRRLQQHLLQRYGAAQIDAGRNAWQQPPCTTREDWLAASHAEAARTAAVAGTLLPRALGRVETDAAWRRIVERDLAEQPLLDPTQAARGAARAWALSCAYNIALPLNAGDDPDAVAFNRWAASYQTLLDELGAVAPESLPRQLLAALEAGWWQPPARLLLAGFDRLTPDFTALLRALQQAGTEVLQLQPPQHDGHCRALPAADRAAELRLAAARVRALAKAEPEARIGVVIHDLGTRREAVIRAFDAALCPERQPGDPPETRPWNLSLGAALSEQALVGDALDWLDWAARGGSHRPLDEVLRLLQSPYWPGRQAGKAIAACELRWRRRRHDTLSLRQASSALVRHGEQDTAAEAAATRLEALSLADGSALPSRWAASFAAALDGLGWPRSETLETAEFQALQAWNETLAQLGSLDGILGRVRATTAAAHLRAMCGNRLFQPRGEHNRIQVLGALEAGGLDFDHLLLLGMEESAWPPPAEPNPFIPLPIQRAAGIPEASAEGQLESARRISARLLTAAPEIEVLWPQQIDEQPVAPSPLLGLSADAMPAENPPDERWSALFGSATLEDWQDVALPAPSTESPLRGGIGRLREQAECPFRSAAHHGLGATAPEPVPPAPDPLERGLLLHAALAELWRGLRDQQGLLALNESARAEAITGAVGSALERMSNEAPHRFTAGVCAIEEQRLPRQIGQLLAIDAQRPPFTVEMIEGASPDAEASRRSRPVIEIAGLQLQVVPDRVDALEGGGRLVIDYKTGAAGGLLADRLRAPQLPVYAELVEDCVGVAYALLRAQGSGYDGLLDEACGDALPGARPVEKLRSTQREAAGVECWADLRTRWRDQLTTLASEILQGHAVVAPLAPDSCAYCDLHAVCRIGDREQA